MLVGTLLIAALGMAAVSRDWLIDPTPYVAEIRVSPDSIEVGNGLVSRRWRRVGAGIGCYSLRNETTGEEFIRSIRPEALLTLDGQAFEVGGLDGQPVHNFVLPEWLETLREPSHAFRLQKVTTGPIQARLAYKAHPEWQGSLATWPPKGSDLVLHFQGPKDTKDEGVEVDVHIEIYDGLPLFCKWFEVRSARPVTIDSFVGETLACVEGESNVDATAHPRYPNLAVETDYAGVIESVQPTVRWVTDPTYRTQVNYNLQTPCLLEVGPQLGPKQLVEEGKPFRSIRTWLLANDATDDVRKTLARNRMYRTIAPWATENPLIFHCSRSDTEYVKGAIDQAAAVGFELVIMTFGSGYNVEDESPANLARMKELADYAHSKGVALGGYSLLASRSIDAQNDVINPKTGKPGGFATFGESPCLGSAWGQDYFRKMKAFYAFTGCDVLEHDGSYPGDACASTSHPGHRGYEDSRWAQWKAVTGFYAWCRSRGIYLNVPDWYYLSGSNKNAMGYRETNWSLPRAQQEIIERQNIHDGLRTKTPTMGWMFVPLMEYQGGGAEATVEPLHAHLDHYERRLQNLLGAGVQACYRGPRLFDTPETEAMVKKWVHWYKSHRAILDSDVIPLRRADGRDWDGLLHVNPHLPERGLAALYNPLKHPIQAKVRLPLALAGLTGGAKISVGEGPAREVPLDASGNAEVEVTIGAQGFSYLLIAPG